MLKEDARAWVQLEPGVISIYPLFQRDSPILVRIVEIYTGRKAYESHLKTPHYQKYKTTTLKMNKSVKLVDMDALDPETMSSIVQKNGSN